MHKLPPSFHSRPLLARLDDIAYKPISDPEVLRRFMATLRSSEDPQQLTLDGLTPNGPTHHVPQCLGDGCEPIGFGLFFAGFPELEDAPTLCAQGARSAREWGLRDAVQVPERAHVTLCSLNSGDPLELARHDAAKAAANRLSCAMPPLVFDRACSFKADGAFMLLGDAATNATIAKLRRPLVAALRRFGLKPGEIKMPHMTMVYNCGTVVPEHAIGPLTWRMRRFALVLSHIGCAHHEYLTEWTLPSL